MRTAQQMLRAVKQDTMITSVPWVIEEHPEFQKLVKMAQEGERVIPVLHDDLKKSTSIQTILALHEIVGSDPFDESVAGDIYAVANAWLGWLEQGAGETAEKPAPPRAVVMRFGRDGKIFIPARSERKDWDESKHPRDPGGEGGGQFTSTGGGGDGGDTDEYGLAPRERQALADWMGSGYRDLRTDPNFAKVLDKLPTVTGMYFRGTRMTDEQLATFQNGVGRVTKFDKHSSSSQRRGSAKEFMESQRHSAEKRNPVLFEIAGTGQRIPRPLAQEAGATDETEVVILMGERYRVDGVEKITDDDVGVYYKIKMSKV